MMSYIPIIFLTAIFSIFNILFVRKIIQYYLGRSSRMEAFKFGLFGCLWPYICWFIIENLFAPPMVRTFALPIPILLLVSIFTLRQGKDVYLVCKRISSQIWIDEDLDSRVYEEAIPEEIKVPLWYSVVSRFRKHKRTWIPNEQEEPHTLIESFPEVKVPWWYSLVSRFRRKEVEAWDPNKDIDDPWSSTESQ
jgi:hypothetical protein